MENIKFVLDRDPHEREFHQAVSEVLNPFNRCSTKTRNSAARRSLNGIVEPEKGDPSSRPLGR